MYPCVIVIYCNVLTQYRTTYEPCCDLGIEKSVGLNFSYIFQIQVLHIIQYTGCIFANKLCLNCQQYTLTTDSKDSNFFSIRMVTMEALFKIRNGFGYQMLDTGTTTQQNENSNVYSIRNPQPCAKNPRKCKKVQERTLSC